MTAKIRSLREKDLKLQDGWGRAKDSAACEIAGVLADWWWVVVCTRGECRRLTGWPLQRDLPVLVAEMRLTGSSTVQYISHPIFTVRACSALQLVLAAEKSSERRRDEIADALCV